jgi:hypothetical protein
MIRFLKHWRLAGVIFAGAVVLREARGGVAYLPFIGPPPLRFQAVVTPAKSSAVKLVLAEPRVTESTNAVLTNAVAAPPPAVPKPAAAVAVVVSLPVTNNAVSSAPLAAENPTKPAAPAVLPIPADNLLSITPQSLAGYFVPGGGRNAGGMTLAVPVKVDFVPPPPSGIESRAEYKVQ